MQPQAAPGLPCPCRCDKITIYVRLSDVSHRELDAQTSIIVSYYLHVIYGLFENSFTRIAAEYGVLWLLIRPC